MLKQAYYGCGAAVAAVERRYPFGRNIYSEDWDICIVLDSCRLDMFQDAFEHRDIVSNEGAWSVGSITTEWLTNTFRPKYSDAINKTAFVSATPHSTSVFRDGDWLTNHDDIATSYPTNPAVDPDAFDGFYEVWREEATEHNAVPPSTMRDATVEAYDDHDRVVAHWLQPHEPFIAPGAEIVGGDPTATNVWDGLGDETYSPEEVWQSYVATLELALEELRRLLNSVDARVLITADHGNAFGEWGVYGHPFAWPQPEVRRVPWALVDASPRVEVDKTNILTTEYGHVDTEEQLRALGYR